MSTEYGGSFTLGQLLPLPSAVQVGLLASLTAQQAQLQPQLDGLLAISVRPPPSLPELIAAAEQLLASLQSLLAAPLPDIGAVLLAIADLQATLASISAQFAPAISLGNFLSAAGVHYYVFAGQVQTLGPDLQGLLASGLPGSVPTAEAAGVVLLATDAGAVEAIRGVFR